MKIVDYSEFVRLPDPVYYAEIGTGGLFRRGNLIGEPVSDFFEHTIVPPTNAEDLSEIGGLGRWGAFDRQARFCVFDERDIAAMLCVLCTPGGAK